MYLIPLVRTSRAICTCLIFQKHPVECIAVSEILSYVIPFINYPNFQLNIIGFTLYLWYAPEYTHQLMTIYFNQNKFYYNLEIILLISYITNDIINDYLR